MISVHFLSETIAVVLKMWNDFSNGYGKNGERKPSSGNQRLNDHVESEVFSTKYGNNGFGNPLFNSKKENSQTFEDFLEFNGQEVLHLYKLTAWEERCRQFSSNDTLPLPQKLRLGCAVENNDSVDGESYIIESLGSFSSPAEHASGTSRHDETINSGPENNPISARFKNQRRKERKSSLNALSVLPPLVEEKYNSSPAPVIRRKTIGSIGERDRFEVPDIVLSKVDDAHRDTERLKLPTIEPKSGHLQMSLSSSDPNRLGPPSILGPFKAFRPPVQARSKDKNTIDNVRLPQLKTQNSSLRADDEQENGFENPTQ